MLIEVSGIDGSGKSTLAAAISGALIRSGVKTHVRSQHSHTRRMAQSLSDAIHRSRGDYIGHDAVEFAAALELIGRSHELHLASFGASVFILDPYITCSAAMAATMRVKNLPAILDAYAWAHPADLTLHLDVSAETALRRIRARPASDNVTLRNAEQDLQDYNEGFEKVLTRLPADSLIRLDGEGSAQSVAQAAADEVIRRLSRRRAPQDRVAAT